MAALCLKLEVIGISSVAGEVKGLLYVVDTWLHLSHRTSIAAAISLMDDFSRLSDNKINCLKCKVLSLSHSATEGCIQCYHM